MTKTVLDITLAPLLEAQSMTYEEMMAATGYSRPGVTNWLRTQTTYVAGWDADAIGRYTVPRFRLGRGKNAPRPAPKTSAERMRKHRENLL